MCVHACPCTWEQVGNKGACTQASSSWGLPSGLGPGDGSQQCGTLLPTLGAELPLPAGVQTCRDGISSLVAPSLLPQSLSG